MSHINIIIKLHCCVLFTNGDDTILTIVLPLCSVLSLSTETYRNNSPVYLTGAICW